MNTKRPSYPIRRTAALLAVVAVTIVAAVFALAAPVLASAQPRAVYQTVEELEGGTIAYINGSVYGLAVAERVDNTTEVYYASLPDCVVAVESGKADAACGISYCCELAVNRSGGGIAMVPELVKDIDEAFFFQKGSPLTAQFDEVLAKLEADGTLAELQEKWVAASDEGKTLPEQDWDAPNGTLKFATSGVLEPFSYAGPGGEAFGYDVELALLIAKELGYHIETQMIAMDSIFAAVETGKVDFGGTLTVTPEREEMVDFSEGVIDAGIGLIVKADGDADDGALPTPEYTSFEELAGKRFGNITGSIYGDHIVNHVPDHGEILNFNSPADLAAALKAGRIDGFAVDEPMARLLIARNEGLTLFPEHLEDNEYGYFFQKGSPLVAQVNEVLERFWEDGTIDALVEKWITSADDGAKTMPEQDWEAPNGTLTFAGAPLFEPMCYTGAGGQMLGYDAELAALICKELGYRLEFESYTVDGVIAAVQSGKADFGGDATTITEERSQTVDFSIPNYHGAVVLVVRSAEGEGGVADFLAGIRDSFERTFITEDRWQMILSGLGLTLLITLAASALGFIINLDLTLLRNANPTVDKLVRAYQTLMSGLPIVVVLMILYYVVFGALDIPGIIVAILGFALSFGAQATFNTWNAVETVDKGQEEAALALGYSKLDAFTKIVLPEAAHKCVPVLLGQVVSLVKETSIVGYIAVQDLTRASDLIRSRTMEAFFPLIATAIIYFVICWAVRRIGTWVIELWNPEKRPREIKGVRP